MSYERKLKALYNALPKVDIPCPSGCVECCVTPFVPWGRLEVEALYHATGKLPELLENGACNFAIEGRCSVYEYRPFMCRLFGLSDTKGFHHCERGIRTTTPLASEKVYELLDKYRKLVDKTGGPILPIGAEAYVSKLQGLIPDQKVTVLKKPIQQQRDPQALHRLRSLLAMTAATSMGSAFHCPDFHR